MIKLALTDMDDTLVAAGNDGVSARAIDAIHAMQEAGLHFGPVSGRQPGSMGWMFKGHTECHATGAFSNGQVIYADGEVVAAHPLDSAALMRLADYLDSETDDSCLKVYDLGDDFLGTGGAIITHDPTRAVRTLGARGNAWLKGEESPCRTEVGDGPVYKANIWSTRSREELVALRERIAAEVPEIELVFPNNNVRLFDLLPAGWNKGRAVEELARILGVSMDEVAVFGDSDNDLPMIEAVPNSVAVANANEAVAAAARWHIGAASEDAVADALLDIAHAAKTGVLPAFMRYRPAC